MVVSGGGGGGGQGGGGRGHRAFSDSGPQRCYGQGLISGMWQFALEDSMKDITEYLSFYGDINASMHILFCTNVPI